jgi:hypothetical protein
MSLPNVVNLDAYRGDTWQQTLRFAQGGVPLDLTGATVACELRNGASRSELVVTITDPASGAIMLTLPDPPPAPGAYAYDVEVTMPGMPANITTWVRGRLTITRDVTNEQPQPTT